MLQFKINKDMKDINGWGFTTKTGVYGTDYLMRAFVTAIGLGANRPQDAIYPTSMKDAEDRTYDGANKYVVRFPKGQLPPVTGFWSITMYDGIVLLRAEPDQPLFDQRAAEPENKSGRLDRPLYSEGLARKGQGIELAAGASRQIHPDAADVLAERKEPVDHQRHLGAASCEKGRLAGSARFGRLHGALKRPPASGFRQNSALSKRAMNAKNIPRWAAVCLAVLLGGCSSHDMVNTVSRPGKFRTLSCEELTKKGLEVVKREKELREQIEKAKKGPGGEVAIALAYQNEYNMALGDLQEVEFDRRRQEMRAAASSVERSGGAVTDLFRRAGNQYATLRLWFLGPMMDRAGTILSWGTGL